MASTLIASFLQTPVYRGEVKVILESVHSLFDSANGDRPEGDRLAATEIEVIKSEAVKAAVEERFGPVDDVQAVPVGESDVIAVTAESTDRNRAAAITEAYAVTYIEFRRNEAVADLVEASENLEATADDLQERIEVLDAQIAAASNQGDATGNLVASRDALSRQQALLRQRLDDLQVQAELQDGGARLVTKGNIPTSKVRPSPLRNGLLAFPVALVLGVGLALVLEYLDESIKSKHELRRIAAGLPVLGMIPSFDNRQERADPASSFAHPDSPAAESYRTLRTALQFLSVDRVPKVYQVTSAKAQEGKTTTISNLGIMLAEAGQQVLLVDCDLRRPRLHEAFDVSGDLGFTTLLADEGAQPMVEQEVREHDGLRVVASGPLPPNPSELLSSKRTAEVLALLQDKYDVVLLDCPPVLPVADALALSAWVDATLLVVKAGNTRTHELQQALDLLQQAEAPLIGTVLNGADQDQSYGYPYRYGYSANREETSRSRARQDADRLADNGNGVRDRRKGRLRSGRFFSS